MPHEPQVFRVEEYNFRENDPIFFDTNIWLFLLDPFGDPNDARVKTYSQAYARILRARCQIFVDAIVISEFVNRSLKLQHEADKRGGADERWKIYRRSDDYRYAVERLGEQTSELLSKATFLDAVAPDWEEVLGTLKNGQRDLSDELIVHQCQKHDLLLLTDDGDFKDAPIDIISANSRLIR